MVKEVKVYQADDGKTYKTRQGAENHNKRLAVQDAMTRLDMSSQDISEALQKATEHNRIIRMLLKSEPNWEKWYIQHIKQLKPSLFEEPLKKTIYVLVDSNSWRKQEKELYEEEGEIFQNPEKHLESDNVKYKLVDTIEVDSRTLKVVYDYAQTWEERTLEKLQTGESISEDDIRTLALESEQIYEEEGDEGRWERHMTTVVDLLGNQYAIDWSRGLTESQENSFYEQPYPVRVETKEVTVTKTYIVPISKEK